MLVVVGYVNFSVQMNKHNKINKTILRTEQQVRKGHA